MTRPIPDWLVKRLKDQATLVERSIEVFQDLQARLPHPSLEDIEEIRRRHRPITRHEYLLARLQRVIVDLENVVSDLRVDLEYEFEPTPLSLRAPDVNALVAATEPDPRE